MQNNTEQQIQTQAASLLDKTDWRKTIHRCLESCVKLETTFMYPQAVKSLVSAVSANYPGFPAKDNIDAFVKELNKEYEQWTKDYVTKYPEFWHHPIKRKIIETQVVNDYYKDIFEFIKNLLAAKRILLWGIRYTPGGSEMEG